MVAAGTKKKPHGFSLDFAAETMEKEKPSYV